MIVIGLTGSIAMGKSTAAGIFADMGVPVCDSDAVVHALYEKGEKTVAAAFPDAVRDGKIDRTLLSRLLAEDEADFATLEAIVHPLVRRAQDEFLRRCREENEDLAVLDIPLLFETGRGQDVDKVVVVSAPAGVQRARALARPGMTEEKFESILKRQIPDAEKRRRADFVVDSSQGLDHARAAIRSIIRTLAPNRGD